MKSDNYFEIGSSHEVCQDYALSGAINDNIHYAIVSDGCSMSHKECGQVDFGARVLANAAKDILCRMWEKDEDATFKGDITLESTSKFLRERAIIMTRMIERQLDLPHLYADCTLLVAVADNLGNAHAFIYGDGSVFVKFKDGSERIVDLTFLSGAPYYLSYQTDPARKQAYAQAFGDDLVLLDEYLLENGEIDDKLNAKMKVTDRSFFDNTAFQWENVEYITVVSDGAKSYQKGQELVPYIDVLSEMNAFKNKNGVFVQRRMKSMGKAHKKAEICHYDDISVASIITE